MKKTARIDALRNIRKRFVSWLSMATIVFIGTSIILGLYFTCSSLKDVGFKYINNHNFKDMDVACTQGIRDQELERISQVPGVRDAEGVISLAGQFSSDNKNTGAYIFSCTDRISVPYAQEGRIPTASNECGICSRLADKLGVSVGDEITIQVTTSRLSSVFSDGRYIVTGIVGHPDYMGKDRVDYCLLPKCCFDTSQSAFDYTNLVVDFDIPEKYTPISPQFAKEMNRIRKEMLDSTDELTQMRTESLARELDAEYASAEAEANRQLGEAKVKIDAGQKEFDEKIAEAEKKLSDGEAKLNEGREKAEKELADGAKKIKDGEEEYNTKIADGEKQLADAEARMEKELADAKWKIFDGFLQLDEAEKLLNEKEEEYARAHEALDKGKVELDEGMRKLEEALEKVNDNVNDRVIQNIIDDIQELIDDPEESEEAKDYFSDIQDKLRAVKGKDAIEKCDELLAIYDSIFGAFGEKIKSIIDKLVGIERFRKDLNDLKDGKAKVEKGQRDYEEGKKKLEEARKLLDQGWYDLKKGKEELAAGEAELARREPEARKQLADAKADFEQKKADGAKQLEDAKKLYASKKKEAEEEIARYEKELEEGREEFNTRKEEGEKELAEAKEKYEAARQEAEEKLSVAREQIQRAKESPCNWFYQTRDANLYYTEFQSYCDILNKVFVAFTPIYAAVVAIVCFFTMAIIVEEQSKQTGTCKALGMYKSEIRAKYLLFGSTAAIFGALIGLVGAFGIERLVCGAIKTVFVFGAPPHKFELIPTLLVPVGATLVTAIAVYWSSERILSCSAVGLVSGNEPVNRARKKAAKKAMGNVYTKLILNNFLMDMGRETVSVVVITVCCMLIGLGTTIKLAHLGAMENQVDNILLYDICLTVSENITEGEKGEILDAISDFEYITTTKLGGVIENDDGQGLTEAYVVDDQDEFRQFFSIMDMKGNEITLPDDGIVPSFEMDEKNGLYDGREVTFITTNLKMGKVKVNGHFLYHAGKLVFLTADYYRNVFGTDPDENTFLIKTNGRDIKEVMAELAELKGVSELGKADDLLTEKAGMIKLYSAVVVIVIAFSIMLSFMILLNLSNILVSHRMKELLTMRVNGFSGAQVIGYLVREVLVTTSLGLLFGIVIGIPVTSLMLRTLEGNGFMFLRGVYALAWLLSVACNLIFSFVINSVAFRKVNKVPLTDITKY